MLDALTLAIEQSHATHLLYQSDRATEPAFRDVYPYGFIYHSASIYLVALDPAADGIKHYKVDRVEAVEVSNFPFQRPPDFDIAAHLSPSFGVFLSDGAPDDQGPLRPGRGSLRPGIKVAPQPGPHQAARRQPAGAIRARVHRGIPELGDVVRTESGRPRARGTAAGDRRRVAGNPDGIRDPRNPTMCTNETQGPAGWTCPYCRKPLPPHNAEERT